MFCPLALPGTMRRTLPKPAAACSGERPRSNGLPLARRKLHLLFTHPQILVDPVRSFGEVLHLLLVLEELQPLGGKSRFQPRRVRLRDLLGIARFRELVRLRRLLLLQPDELLAGREQLQLAQLGAQLAELLGLLRRALERREPL